MIKTLRWILVAPAAVAGWFMAFAAAIYLYGELTGLCPPGAQYEQDLFYCRPRMLDYAIFAGASLSAVLVVLFAVICAPSNKQPVAWLTFTVGALLAIFLQSQMGADGWLPFSGAMGFGLLTTIVIHRRTSRRSIFDDRQNLRLR